MKNPSIYVPSQALFLSRRRAMSASGAAVLSASAVALLGGRDALAAGAKVSAQELEADVRILNTALGAELEAVAAYQVGAESGLLSKAVLPVAVAFQGHHKEHAAAIASTVQKLGGKPVVAKEEYHFPVEKLKVEADVLRLAAGLERGAISAYLGAVPLFADRALAQVAASILGDEAMHWAVLRQALGEAPVPSAFMS
ncbi:ferritin-like domain-containing protein [Acidovorax radicis]|jgi:bacterioferritin (cytochrome b1)|uniref:ferritin-like domain-containing protein n=1 Tax=Acidovorax radicis TaxID=758826 RepID=UPI001CFC09B8|nr:ferritin-like domain-containing protein [Acidovorax radicis]UCV00012.1 ferritin-like domain-containing protein [Acidovorax radicis]